MRFDVQGKIEKHRRIPSHAAPAPPGAAPLPMPSIDTTTYRRDLKWGIGNGCAPRPSGISPSSIVVHTTNGKKGSTFDAEARYLRDNTVPVSSHYLVGKQGQIAQIVPDYLQAYHAGATVPGYSNGQSIGIECHLTPGEAWMPAQREALTWLVESCMAQWNIARGRVDTHRAVAVPSGRKSDPAEWPDVAFYQWRDTLGLIEPAQHQVIGVAPSIVASRFLQLLERRNAPFAAEHFSIITGRIYNTCSWLEVDPAFWLALWTREQFVGGKLGASEIGIATHNPLNIKAYDQRMNLPANETPRWHRTSIKGALWNSYESWQLGCLCSLMHLKEMYGARGLLHVETIIPVWAPKTDRNDPAAYIAAVNADMKAMHT